MFSVILEFQSCKWIELRQKLNWTKTIPMGDSGHTRKNCKKYKILTYSKKYIFASVRKRSFYEQCNYECCLMHLPLGMQGILQTNEMTSVFHRVLLLKLRRQSFKWKVMNLIFRRFLYLRVPSKSDCRDDVTIKNKPIRQIEC